MFRRFFLKKAGLALMASGIALPQMSFKSIGESNPKRLKAHRLKPGATVALIAPSSPPSEEKLVKAISNLESLGFNIKEGKSLRSQYGYLAGTDEARLSDLHWAFEDDSVDAVWCVRGGYGASRLLPKIDYRLIRKHPKPFIGFSDVTALHLAIHARCGLVCFHGPVAVSDFPEFTLQHFKAVVMNGTDNHVIEAPIDKLAGDEYQAATISPGTAKGQLTGGNLTLLSALVGTPFAPVFSKKIVFIEEVGEQPYRIDRMLTQLLQGTDLSKAAGIALGVFSDCQAKQERLSLSLMDTLRDRLGKLQIPVVYGMPVGHVALQATLPYGILAELDASAQKLTLLEAAVR